MAAGVANFEPRCAAAAADHRDQHSWKRTCNPGACAHTSAHAHARKQRFHHNLLHLGKFLDPPCILYLLVPIK